MNQEYLEILKDCAEFVEIVNEALCENQRNRKVSYDTRGLLKIMF